MEIIVKCKINETELQNGLQALNITKQEFARRLTECFKIDIFETLEDNQELFETVSYQVVEKN